MLFCPRVIISQKAKITMTDETLFSVFLRWKWCPTHSPKQKGEMQQLKSSYLCLTYVQHHVVRHAGSPTSGHMSQIITQLTDCQFVKTCRWSTNESWKRVQDSDWLWNLKLLYWKRQAHASFNTFSARWPSLTRNSPKSHAMSAENTEWPLLPYGITKSGGVSCTRKTEFVKLRLSESIVADLTSLVSTNTANLLGHIHNYWTYIILSSN